MNNYIKFNENRWNNVNNDYTEPLTHEQLEELKNKPISVALTIGKKVPEEWFEKANGKKILGLACGGGQQGPVFALKGYDVTIMDFSTSQLERDEMVAKREGLTINTVQGDMTKPFPFENETFDIIFNPVSNVYIEDLENSIMVTSYPFKAKTGPCCPPPQAKPSIFFPLAFSNHSSGTFFPIVNATEIGFFLTSSISSCVNGSV